MKPAKITWDVIIDCFAVLLSDCNSDKKKAANIILKYFAPKDVYEFIMQEVEKVAPVTDRNDPRVLKWRRRIVKRGHCELCGSTDRLEAHHILYWSESPKDRIDVNNGICLCHECHLKEHEGEQVYQLMLSRK